MKPLQLSYLANCLNTESLARFRTRHGTVRKDIPDAERRLSVSDSGEVFNVTVVPVSFSSLPTAKWADVVTGSLYDADGRCLTGKLSLMDA